MKLKNKNVAVLGFGVEGKDLINYLSKKNINIVIHDIKEKNKLDTTGFENYKFICGKDYLKGLDRYDIIFRSPGIYRYEKEIVDAEEKGVIISSATRLFFEKCKGKIIGVTGTKGKGTTAILIYQSLINDGRDAFLLGNIGEPFLEKLTDIKKDTWVVMELSSFQLIDLKKSPHIAVVLNITQDHLDWHKDIDEYIKSKKNILLHQSNKDFAVVSFDYETARSFAKWGKGEKYFFSTKSKVKGAFIDGNEISIDIKGVNKSIASCDDLILQGKHIYENATASVCASFLADASLNSIRKAVKHFKGYEHRMEYVAEIDGITYYNDSAATGPHSAVAALKSFKKPITLILGGFDKGLDYETFIENISDFDSPRNVILIGDIASKLERLFKENKYPGSVFNLNKSPMQEVVKKARKITENGGIVLLSPAASSFDMFENYKDRGNKFKKAVNELL
jgi:UDP-N-acetylmuramoylalanine--D-glutamate ligase